MKKIIFFFLTLSYSSFVFSQVDTTDVNNKLDGSKVLSELSKEACGCIDSIKTFNKSKAEISKDIHACIDQKVVVYQMSKKISNLKDINDTKEKNVNITINTNPESNEYKKYYYEIERELMENCPEIKTIIATNDKVSEKSLSNKEEAVKFYEKGLEAAKSGDCEKAILNYKKALVFDKEFAFAYDDMGICYRRLNDYDNAIYAYEKSLEIDPNGMMPLQNLGVVYIYKKQYKKAINAYERLAKIDPNNPEVYYGIGNVYVSHLNEYEKGLDNLCKAYNIYVEQKSPYRSDAEKLIQIVYNEMKKQGKEELFNTILKKNNISPN